METTLKAFNVLSEQTEIVQKALIKLQQEFNDNVDIINDQTDQLEAAEALKVSETKNAKEYVAKLEFLIRDLNKVVTKKDERILYVESLLNTSNLERRELKALDTKGVALTNKKLKKERDSALERLGNSEKARKEALAQHKIMLKKRQNEGVVCVHTDPTTGNQLRLLPSLRISKTNEYGGVPETPIIEFFHKASGIIRQGTLLTSGAMGWASAKNSTASHQESKIAKLKIVEFCEDHNIKIALSE